MDTRKVWPICESDPMNAALHSHYRSRKTERIIPADRQSSAPDRRDMRSRGLLGAGFGTRRPESRR